MEFLKQVSGHSVYLDTSVVIYALEGFPAYADCLREILAAIDDRRLTACTSELATARFVSCR